MTSMTTLRTLTLASLVFTTAAGASETHELTLVRESAPAASIVIAADATRVAQLAAYELQHHVRLISGATLPIVTDAATVPGARILVGESAATRALGLTNDGFAHQEYLVRFVPETLVLMGRDADTRGAVHYDYLTRPDAVHTWVGLYAEQGTLYATYDFLETHGGVRWINPTDFGTICPRSATLTVKGDEWRRRPFMAFRGGSAADFGEGYQYGGGLWRKDTAEAEAYMAAAYPRLHASYPDARHRGLPLRAQNQLFQYRMKAGGDQRQCNHSFYNYLERFLVKDHKNFESYHPEYFAQGYGEGEPPQLCYSHTGTIAQVVADARDYFDHGGYRKPMRGIGAAGYQWGRDFFALEPMDNSANCRCANCTAQYEPERSEARGEHSTYWFRFVNAVARELKKSHPDKFISTLAYGSHEGLPTGFRIESNVAVHFCLSANREGCKSEIFKSQLARLHEWREREPDAPMYLWLYHTFPKERADNGRYYCYPGFFVRELKKQFDVFHKLGVQGIFHCGFNGEVENYVTYKLMDDPALDIEKLLDTYFAAYGAAGQAMRAWYDLAESRFCDPAVTAPRPGESVKGRSPVALAWDYAGNGETMDKLAALLAEARSKAGGTAAQLVNLWDLGVSSYMRTGRETYVARMQAPIPSVTATRVPAAGGDPDKVAWDQAGDVGDQWYLRGGKDLSKRVFRGRICHDGEYFYLEMVEENVTRDQLHVSAQVYCYDVWEPLFARQRGQPFRQYGVGPTGMTVANSYGEVNWRQDVAMQETGIRAVTDTAANRWVTRLSWPLATLVEEPVKPGETIYMNILRTSNPKLSSDGGAFGVDTWVSFCNVREVDRLGEVKLAP